VPSIPIVVAIPVITAVMTEIPIAVAIPTVIVIYPAALAFPIAREELAAFIARSDPLRAGVGRASPIAVMPAIASALRVPISVYPKIVRSGRPGPRMNDAGRRRRPNSHANR